MMKFKPRQSIQKINGILLLYHHPLQSSAPTIMEYVNAFPRHSRFPVYTLNTELGFPAAFQNLHFSAIVFHYSLFGIYPYQLNNKFYNYLAADPASYKVAIFQDEYHYCRPRFAFVDEYNIDCVYSCYEPRYFDQFYYKYTRVPKVLPALTGYVSEEMLEMGRRFTKPFKDRTLDVSYRGRDLPFYMGKGAREKTAIGLGFLERSQGLGLTLDIKIGEETRIYGEDWYRFLANSRAVLGVESGVSLTDFDDTVRTRVTKALSKNPELTFDEVYNTYLESYDEKVPVRTISPRHFEAAALRVCQVLFEGEYAGVLKPMRHYIPLKKNFSNFDEVIRLLKDDIFCEQIVETAYQDLIASGMHSFSNFIGQFDDLLEGSGVPLQPRLPGQRDEITPLFNLDLRGRKTRWQIRNWVVTVMYQFRLMPGYNRLKPKIKKYFPWLY